MGSIVRQAEVRAGEVHSQLRDRKSQGRWSRLVTIYTFRKQAGQNSTAVFTLQKEHWNLVAQAKYDGRRILK